MIARICRKSLFDSKYFDLVSVRKELPEDEELQELQNGTARPVCLGIGAGDEEFESANGHLYSGIYS